MSIGSQSEGRETCSRGGEFKETLDAKEISKSEDKMSSTLSLVRINRLYDGAKGGLKLRKWDEDRAKKDILLEG